MDHLLAEVGFYLAGDLYEEALIGKLLKKWKQICPLRLTNVNKHQIILVQTQQMTLILHTLYRVIFVLDLTYRANPVAPSNRKVDLADCAEDQSH